MTLAEVRAILSGFAARTGRDGTPHAKLLRLCRAVQHFARYPATDTTRGRPGRWPREFLLQAHNNLAAVLQQKAPGLTPRRFLSHWLPLLAFPKDLQNALDTRQLTVSEAHLLARVTPASLSRASAPGVSPPQARAVRQRLTKQHLRKGGTQAKLRAAVKELLAGKSAARVTEVSAAVKERAAQTDELLEFNPHDATHLLWEEITATAFLLREVEAGQIPDGLLTEVLDLLCTVQAKLAKYKSPQTL